MTRYNARRHSIVCNLIDLNKAVGSHDFVIAYLHDVTKRSERPLLGLGVCFELTLTQYHMQNLF